MAISGLNRFVFLNLLHLRNLRQTLTSILKQPQCHKAFPQPYHCSNRDLARCWIKEHIMSTPDFTSEETYANTRLPVERATTLIPDAYRSREFHEIENERVWAGGWVAAAYTSEVRNAGDIVVAEVAGQSILITRDKQGTLRAFHNVCRHRGSQLIDKPCHRDVIRCPYHSWGYGLDGKLLGAPYFKGLDVSEQQKAAFDTSEAKDFCKDDFPLLAVAAEAWGCFIFVNLDGKAGPLKNWLGDLPERFARFPLDELQLVRRRPYTINANWKLIAENFTEYYHLPWVHPELCTVSGFDNHYRFQGRGMYTGMVTSPLSQNSDSAVRFELPNMPGLDEVENQTAYWILLFPNTAWFLLPNHLFLLNYRPDGPVRTLESADMLVHPSALKTKDAEREIDKIFNFWAMVNDQDVLAVEKVQKGLQSRAYPGGRMCYRFEEPIHRFQNMVIDRMVGESRVPAGDKTHEDLLAVVRGK